MEERINLLLNLLTNIETRGKENLNNLLASIQLVEGLKMELSNKQED